MVNATPVRGPGSNQYRDKPPLPRPAVVAPAAACDLDASKWDRVPGEWADSGVGRHLAADALHVRLSFGTYGGASIADEALVLANDGVIETRLELIDPDAQHWRVTSNDPRYSKTFQIDRDPNDPVCRALMDEAMGIAERLDTYPCLDEERAAYTEAELFDDYLADETRGWDSEDGGLEPFIERWRREDDPFVKEHDKDYLIGPDGIELYKRLARQWGYDV